MKYLKNKIMTINDLIELNIATRDGVIDIDKLEKYFVLQKEKGYNISVIGTEYEKDWPTLIDNEDIAYNKKRFKQKFDMID